MLLPAPAPSARRACCPRRPVAVLVGADAGCVDPALVNAGNVLLVSPRIPRRTRRQLVGQASLVAVLNGGGLGWPMAQDVAAAELAGKPIRWQRPPSWACPACASAAVASSRNLGPVRCAACGWAGIPAVPQRPQRSQGPRSDLLGRPTAAATQRPPVRLDAKDVRTATTLVHDPQWRRVASRRAHAELGGGLGWLLGDAAMRHARLVLSGPEAAALVRLLTMVADDHHTVTGDQRAASRARGVRDRIILACLDRDRLGAAVRAAWVEWARRQPHPKPAWLAPWERLPEPDREADRCIGSAVADLVLAGLWPVPGGSEPTPVGPCRQPQRPAGAR